MSKQSDKNFVLEYQIDQLNGCCGIWEMREFYWADNNDWYYDAMSDNEVPKHQRRYNAEAKRVKREALKTGKCIICTIIDPRQSDKMLLEAFLKAGWREDRKVRSNHGNYYIHLLSVQRRKK